MTGFRIGQRPKAGRIFQLCALAAGLLWLGACATIRVTDPARTADEEFLENVATQQAVDKISANVLRDRRVYIETAYLTSSTQPSDEQQYLLGELRAKLLLNGVRLADRKEDSEIIMEVRSQGISNNHIEFLLGVPATSIGGILAGGIAASTPELSILKQTKQMGFASVAYIAYWRDSGEVVASSGPFVGRTYRYDTWIFGYGPQTQGNIPPTEPEPDSGTGDAKKTPATQPAPAKPQTPLPRHPGKGPYG